ncbi:MAG: hypothetical protein H6747_16230 [Deltaproteobacteria bacterium]|nr:hypothetical protein [Deltaproteobacteria bacterium]
MSTATRHRGAIPNAAVVALLAAIALLAGCRRSPAPAAEQAAPAGAKPADTPIAQPVAADPDPIIAEVDLGHVRVSHVRARLAPGTVQAGADAVLAAIGAAVLDHLALRELAVLDLRPKPGEARTAAVDRLLHGAFAGVDCSRVSAETIRLRYLSDLRRFRHPRSWSVWEAYVPCCSSGEPCPPERRTPCLAAGLPKLRALRAQLDTSLPALQPPVAVTPGDAVPIDDSPCQRGRIPAFEAAVAASDGVSLRRYRFFDSEDGRFPASAFRRADPALEAAVRPLNALGAIVGPIETGVGASVVMWAGHRPARDQRKEDAEIQRVLRAEACAALANAERDAFLERLGRAASVTWRKDAIARAFGAELAARLQPWKIVERPHVPDMTR